VVPARRSTLPDKALAASSVVLLGPDDGIAAELADLLAEQRQIVHSHPFLPAAQLIGLRQQLRADMVFCADQPGIRTPGSAGAKAESTPLLTPGRKGVWPCQ
jgi:hypothetical protein